MLIGLISSCFTCITDSGGQPEFHQLLVPSPIRSPWLMFHDILRIASSFDNSVTKLCMYKESKANNTRLNWMKVVVRKLSNKVISAKRKVFVVPWFESSGQSEQENHELLTGLMITSEKLLNYLRSVKCTLQSKLSGVFIHINTVKENENSSERQENNTKDFIWEALIVVSIRLSIPY